MDGITAFKSTILWFHSEHVMEQTGTAVLWLYSSRVMRSNKESYIKQSLLYEIVVMHSHKHIVPTQILACVSDILSY